jgi:hypothetical protein
MYTVYYYDANPNGLTAWIVAKQFSDKKEAQLFCLSVNGKIL